jgi:hypothetical protein
MNSASTNSMGWMVSSLHILQLHTCLPGLVPHIEELLYGKMSEDSVSNSTELDEGWQVWQTLISSDKKWMYIMTVAGAIVQIDLQKFHAQDQSCLEILNSKLPVKIHVIRLSPDGRYLFTLDDRGRIFQIDLIDPSKCYTWKTYFKGIAEGGQVWETKAEIPDN